MIEPVILLVDKAFRRVFLQWSNLISFERVAATNLFEEQGLLILSWKVAQVVSPTAIPYLPYLPNLPLFPLQIAHLLCPFSWL
jgi:hypothetical protein